MVLNLRMSKNRVGFFFRGVRLLLFVVVCGWGGIWDRNETVET
jgi:hypothetical protein